MKNIHYLWRVIIISFVSTALLLPSNILANDIKIDNDDIELLNEQSNWNDFPSKQNVPLNKEWTITFNNDVDVSSITNDNVYVVDANGKKVATSVYLINEGKKVLINPPEEGYLPKTTYTLYISEDVYSQKKQLLNRPAKMTFTTGTQKVEEDKFVPRKDSSNSIDLKDDINELEEEILTDLLTPVYEEDEFVFKGEPEELKNIVNGDIIILPPNEQYPFGWSKEVVSLSYKGENTVIKTKEPDMEDVIENIDLSQVIPIEADDVTLDPEVYPNIISEHSSGNERTFTIANEEEGSQGTIKVGMEGSDIFISFSDIKLPSGLADIGKITIGGDMKLEAPKINIDADYLTVNQLEFISGVETNFDVNYELLGKKKELSIPLGVPIPIKAYGVAGAQIQFHLIASLNGEVHLGFEITNNVDYLIGLKKDSAGWDAYNHSKTNADFDLSLLAGSLEGRLGAAINLDAQVLQYTLAGVDADAGYKVNVAGQISPEDTCFKLTDALYIESEMKVRSGLNSFLDLPIFDLSLPLQNRSTCDFQDIVGVSVELMPEEVKDLTIYGIDKSNRQKEIELPDESVKFTSGDTNVATVNSFGKVTASPHAKEGDSTHIKITYGENIVRTIDVLITTGIPDEDELIKMMNETGSKIEDVLLKGWYHSALKDDFETLVDELEEHATDRYIEDELQPYYENEMCYECDVSRYPWKLATNLVFEVLEASPNKVVLQSAELTDDFNTGGFHTYTFKKQHNEWLLDDSHYEPFTNKSLNLSRQDAQQHIKEHYLTPGYPGYKNVKVTYNLTGSEERYDVITDKYYYRTYHIFDVKTESRNFQVKFFEFDGYFYDRDHFYDNNWGIGDGGDFEEDWDF